MTTTLREFRLASHAHLACAKTILEQSNASKGTSPAKMPSSAAYIASVSLECSIKARLLFRGGFESVAALEKKQPTVHKALFRGKDGHDLGKLASELRLPALVTTEGKAWNDDATWRRMASSERPYSLRYGSEHLSQDDATSEVQRVEEILGSLLNGLGKARKRRSTR